MQLAMENTTKKKNVDPRFPLPCLAKWYENRSAAISLRFDDACKTHVNVAIPVLNRYGFKGTFMVNPGRRSYKRYKRFWEKEVPGMGHKLGNHTWNHKGASTPQMAEFEIGSVSRLIWDLCPDQSKLMVFASGGGGKKWGGKHWRDADPVYKQLIDKYSLIDLYDGQHPCLSADTKANVGDLCRAAEKAIANNSHQAYTFHRIGKPARDLKGIARYILKGYDIAFNHSKFEEFLGYLSGLRQRAWIAPLIDICKYETEYKNAKLVETKEHENGLSAKLSVATDAKLYDHPLTMIIPNSRTVQVEQITQTDRMKITGFKKKDNLVFHLKPVNSTIEIAAE